MNKYGRTVWCSYDDDIFNIFISARNRSQVIHQVCVTNFNYGFFVTAKIKEEEVSIIQIVIVMFLETNINSYKS